MRGITSIGIIYLIYVSIDDPLALETSPYICRIGARFIYTSHIYAV